MGTVDWRERIDETDAVLIDEYQSGFPVEKRPFQAIGSELDIAESNVVERVTRLREMGVFRRFGAVLNPPVIGSSTLAAVQAPDDRFGKIADVINGYRQVNHNYRRDHEWNQWFVVTASDCDTRDGILEEIEARTGCTVLNLPMLKDYYINLEFPVVNEDSFARESISSTEVSTTHISESGTGNRTELEANLMLAIQDGFPLSMTPYEDVAVEIGASTEDVIDGTERLLADGCIKRVGCIVNHVVTGFDANCMVVWNIPDDELDERGVMAGELPYVTLCYHRPRRPAKDWPYNLFTMIHGRESAAVDAKIDELATNYLPFEHERLYSTQTLKQTGAQYDELVST